MEEAYKFRNGRVAELDREEAINTWATLNRVRHRRRSLDPATSKSRPLSLIGCHDRATSPNPGGIHSKH